MSTFMWGSKLELKVPVDSVEFTPYGKLFLETCDLIDRITEAGFVLTVDLVPDTPLAMGNYHHQTTLRLARHVYNGDRK